MLGLHCGTTSQAAVSGHSWALWAACSLHSCHLTCIPSGLQLHSWSPCMLGSCRSSRRPEQGRVTTRNPCGGRLALGRAQLATMQAAGAT